MKYLLLISLVIFNSCDIFSSEDVNENPNICVIGRDGDADDYTRCYENYRQIDCDNEFDGVFELVYYGQDYSGCYSYCESLPYYPVTWDIYYPFEQCFYRY